MRHPPKVYFQKSRGAALSSQRAKRSRRRCQVRAHRICDPAFIAASGSGSGNSYVRLGKRHYLTKGTSSATQFKSLHWNVASLTIGIRPVLRLTDATYRHVNSIRCAAYRRPRVLQTPGRATSSAPRVTPSVPRFSLDSGGTLGAQARLTCSRWTLPTGS